MTSRFNRFVVLAVALLLAVSGAAAQVANSGRLTGTVTDATQAAVPGASVTVVNDATGTSITTQSGPDGSFTIANLSPGTYTVRVTSQGFKTSEFKGVKIIVGQVYDLKAPLEVGEVQSTITVESGAAVLETASTTIGTSITGRAITELPFSSRDALDLAILMPGAATTGRARQTSFMGLPKGAINITIDGINAQDNVLKSSDGFFTIIRPRIDAVEEFSISTAGQGAEQSGEGAVQIRFETKRGTNEYHGGVWWQHRNDFLNSNYYFNNLGGIPRQRQRLNQFGGNVGGPILKDRLFFFFSMDNYLQPQSISRTRTILSQDSLAGRFTYAVSAVPGTLPPWVTCQASHPRNPTGGPACTADLVAMGSANGFPLNFNSDMMSILNAVESSRTAAGVGVLPVTNTFLDSITFNNPGNSTRRFPDVRFDYNITKNHTFTAIYHYNFFDSSPDFLNGFDRSFPAAPFDSVSGGQISNRNEFVGAWRWNLTPFMSNELRFGLQNGIVSFFPDQDISIYPMISHNLGSVRVRPVLPLVSQPFLAYSTQGRNAPIAQLIETLSWTRGKHSFTFGGHWTELRLESYFASRRVNNVNIGFDAGNDPANAMFNGTNLPGISSGNLGSARSLFGMLTGRVTSLAGTVSVNEDTRQYVPGDPLFQRAHQTEFSIYGTDQWRVHPTLTLNYGLRWEYQGAPFDPKNITFRPVGGVEGVWGVSGEGNLFNPGFLPGTQTAFELNGKRSWYEEDLNNFAPSLGLAWTPSFDAGWYRVLFGGPGKTVFRGNYSMTFTREGISNYTSIAFANPGQNGSLFTLASSGAACPAPPFTGTIPAGCMTLSDVLAGSFQAYNQNPATFPDGVAFNITPFSGQSVNMFSPDLGIPIVQNWSIGIQREITPDTVVEVRYIGNHGTGLWRQVNLNEVNIFENGFLQEFRNAQINLAANGGTSFAPGPMPLPIFTAAFAGLSAGSGFSNSTFITQLNNNVPGAMANSMANSSVYLPRIQAAFPLNFFTVNPHASGGAFLMTNASHSTYNAMTVEVRRRMSHGLQLNANYTWGKALTNYYGDSSASFAGFSTYRNPGRDKGPSPWDLRHTFKGQFLYDLPFGPGQRWSSANGIINRLIEGWTFSGIVRVQSGRIFQLQSGQGGTFNQNDPGVTLIGITPNELQEMLKVRTGNGQVQYFPDSLIDSNGQANPNFIRACGDNGTTSDAGQFCHRLFFYGPAFIRTDLNVAKRFRITEQVNFVLRAEFLNAFNNINFFYPGSETTSVPFASVTSSTFGRITNAYRDSSTTDDNGGRIIQLVLRINF